MFLGHGYIQVKDGVRIIADLDLIRYYHKLIDYHQYKTQKLQLPSHGAHITIINPKIHKNIDIKKALHHHGRNVTFTYFPEKMYKSPKNFWIPVSSKVADKLKTELGVDDGKNFWGLHMTVANTKFENA
jgi:hypothetical protein